LLKTVSDKNSIDNTSYNCNYLPFLSVILPLNIFKTSKQLKIPTLQSQKSTTESLNFHRIIDSGDEERDRTEKQILTHDFL